MLSLIGNVALPEVVLIAVVAVIIFGRRLPQVAARVYAQFHRAREALDRLRRESGIDREMRDIQRTVNDAARRLRLEESLEPPPGLTRAREAADSSEADAARVDASDEDDGDDADRDSPDGAIDRDQETHSKNPEGPVSEGEAGDFVDRRESG